jgi:2-dehydro-3-deoxyphosphogluconate aldolase/(4S)-4-hydroxy-2-oxoglutarate aldolase
MDINSFKKLPVLGILRGIEADEIEPIVETVVSAGLRTIEITMNTPGAPGLIKQMVKTAQKRLVTGAGTVLTMDDLHAALDAGATFIVLPTLVRDVVEHCAKNSIPVFPGALTPQEIYNAWNAGATMVKVFPAQFFGPLYFKEIKGPFQDIELLACGGVKADNIRAFFSNGASAVAFGGSIFKKEWISEGKFDRIGESIRKILEGFSSTGG